MPRSWYCLLLLGATHLLGTCDPCCGLAQWTYLPPLPLPSWPGPSCIPALAALSILPQNCSCLSFWQLSETPCTHWGISPPHHPRVQPDRPQSTFVSCFVSHPAQAMDSWACINRCLLGVWPHHSDHRKWEAQRLPIPALYQPYCFLWPKWPGPPWRQDTGSVVTHTGPSMRTPACLHPPALSPHFSTWLTPSLLSHHSPFISTTPTF
jgi:hypothetical protein